METDTDASRGLAMLDGQRFVIASLMAAVRVGHIRSVADLTEMLGKLDALAHRHREQLERRRA